MLRLYPTDSHRAAVIFIPSWVPVATRMADWLET